MTTDSDSWNCERHGAYLKQRARTSEYDAVLFRDQSDCPACEIEARNLESAWRADWQRWRRYEASGIPNRFADATLDNWTPRGELQTAAHRIVSDWCSEFSDNGVSTGLGLTFTGPPGLGKTHLACAVLVETLRNTPLTARYAQWVDTLSMIKAQFGRREHERVDILDDLKNADVLVLDEIGMRMGSEFDTTSLFELIDSRYRWEQPTIVCTNVPLDGLVAVVGERIVDRLREMNAPVFLQGASNRGTPRARGPSAIVEPSLSIDVPRCYAGKASTRRIDFDRCENGRRRLA